MHIRSRIVGLTAIFLFGLSSAAAARSVTVTGRLSAPGYTVVALGYNGKTAISTSQSFKLRAPDRRFTLQLITSKGVYGGPVVVAYRGKFALEGITRSVRLGRIEVLVRSGYARPVHLLPRSDVDPRRIAYTHNRAPIGNGLNFGFVRSPGHAAAGPGLDQDQSGVPDLFNVARNGKMVLNALEPAAAAVVPHNLRAHDNGTSGTPGTPGTPPGTPGTPPGTPGTPSGTSGTPSGTPGTPPGSPGTPPAGSSGFNWMSQIFLSLEQTVNADAGPVSTGQIDSTLVQNLNVKGLNIPTADLVELDCGGLPYCSPGGTGQVVSGYGAGGAPQTVPFTNSFDPAGFGVLVGPGAAPLESNNGTPEFSLMPRATAEQIKTGDTPILRTTAGGVLTQTPTPIDFVFDTVPALSSYDDGAGHVGTVNYPAAAGDPGTQSNPLPVAANSTGDVVLSLKFWRPQRAGIVGAGEPAFMDIGHLEYTVDATSLAQAAAGPTSQVNASTCSAASLSSTDPNLSVSQNGGGGYLVDSAADQPANPANLLSFNIDLTRCITDGGGTGFPVGTQGMLGLKANAPGSADHAVQNIWIRRVS